MLLFFTELLKLRVGMCIKLFLAPSSSDSFPSLSMPSKELFAFY